MKNRNQQEVEIKLRLSSVEEGKRLLRSAGFRVSKRRLFESKTVLDTPASELHAASQLLRLRPSRNAHTLTF